MHLISITPEIKESLENEKEIIGMEETISMHDCISTESDSFSRFLKHTGMQSLSSWDRFRIIYGVHL